MTDTPAARYTGTAGAFLGGIPARHLTVAEYGALSDDDKTRVAQSGLYTLHGDAPAVADAAHQQVVAAQVDNAGLDWLTAHQRSALADAGLDTPEAILAATPETLRAVPGIGDATVSRIRAVADGQV